MCAFVVLGVVFHTKPTDWLGERLQNNLFCVKQDVKPQLNQSISPHSALTRLGDRKGIQSVKNCITNRRGSFFIDQA